MKKKPVEPLYNPDFLSTQKIPVPLLCVFYADPDKDIGCVFDPTMPSYAIWLERAQKAEAERKAEPRQ